MRAGHRIPPGPFELRLAAAHAHRMVVHGGRRRSLLRAWSRGDLHAALVLLLHFPVVAHRRCLRLAMVTDNGSALPFGSRALPVPGLALLLDPDELWLLLANGVGLGCAMIANVDDLGLAMVPNGDNLGGAVIADADRLWAVVATAAPGLRRS